jgi:hypothetical protein
VSASPGFTLILVGGLRKFTGQAPSGSGRLDILYLVFLRSALLAGI